MSFGRPLELLRSRSLRHLRSLLCIGALVMPGADYLVLSSVEAAEEKQAAGEGTKAKTRDVKTGEITLSVPESWKQGKPTSSLRLAQFAIPAAEGDSEAAELAIFSFKGGGGGVNANVQRWIDQFLPEGREVNLYTGVSKQGKYALVDIKGTYKKPIGPPIQQKTEPLEGARMLGVVLTTEDAGDYFLKLSGLEKTIDTAADSFRTAFGGKTGDETEVQPKKKDAAE